ncbi:hypothetical protein [Ferrovibrio xuzhouensis]|uniref:Phasin protein n=1 Tax=Ferrovibrio xuzhouensis TaxID=1576914 RepID=A0ABV7VG75_9PROT
MLMSSTQRRKPAMATPQNSKTVPAPGNTDITQAAQAQAEQLWAVQGRVLGIYGDFMKHWFERRQEAARSAIEMTQKAMHADGQPVNLPALYGEWVSHSMQRLATDLQECQECGSEITAMLGGTMPQWPGFAGFEPKQARPAAKN